MSGEGSTIEIYGNLWQQFDADVIFITTNGALRSDGTAIMGRGCASEAKQRYPGIEKILGEHIIRNGNVPGYLKTIRLSESKPTALWSFPVKEQWRQPADLHLIERSALRIRAEFLHTPGGYKLVLPRPGCGSGRLNWEAQVKPRIERLLDDKFYVIELRQQLP